ncbi:indolepyruvate ferredoxin oxidoreductase subunit alpha, partial [Vibrio parahaemolyticus]|nr:indolepyruvate ferredoxin oxidoreductase subunit alpha [Vibrio parahaemolyticus]
DLVMVILDNRITAMTGHQENPGTGKNIKGEAAPTVDIESIVKACGVKEENVKVINPYNMVQNKEAIKAALEADGPFVIITKQPCALIKEVQKKRASLYSEVDNEKCTNCKTCFRIGCPAISMIDDKVVIDKVQCNG